MPSRPKNATRRARKKSAQTDSANAARRVRKNPSKATASISDKATKGVASTAEAPGGLRRFFRFSQLAVGEAGGARNIEDIWATTLQELADSGVPAEATARIEALGAKKVLSAGAKLPGSITKLAGNAENSALIRETLVLARKSLKGIPAKGLSSQVESFLKLLAKEPSLQDANGRRIIEELRKANPAAIAQVGANQTISVLSKRAEDPFVTSLYRKALKRSGSAVLPEAIEKTLSDAVGGKLPKVAAAARAGLKGEIAGAGALAAGVRKGAGFLGRGALGAAGVGITAALEIGRAKDILGRGGRAKQQALQGFQELGPSSSVEFLRDTVKQQESVARRKAVLQQFEPDLFNEVIRVLSDTGQSKQTLTSTERRIGSNARVGAESRGRDPKDVEFLLDQLFSQMG